jgi:hypothetical protein
MEKIAYTKIGAIVADIEAHEGDPAQHKRLLAYLSAQINVRAAVAKLEGAIYELGETLKETA